MAAKDKKTRKRTQRRGFSWLAAALGGGLLLLAVILLAIQDERGTPSLVVSTQRIDHGFVKFGEIRTFEVKVTNTGDGPLRFTDQPYIEIVEGC